MLLLGQPVLVYGVIPFQTEASALAFLQIPKVPASSRPAFWCIYHSLRCCNYRPAEGLLNAFAHIINRDIEHH